MPAKPIWLKKVRLIRASVEASRAPFLDRAAIESVFGLGPRQASKLLARMAPLRVGNAHVAPREAVLRFLRGVERGSAHQLEATRSARVRELLEEARKNLMAKAVRFAVPPPARTLADLPGTIQLASGELRIAFSSAEDLLRQLFQLSRAMGNDFPRFQALIENDTARP